MTSPRSAQSYAHPDAHNPRYYYYNESSHLWEVVVPLTDGNDPQMEWIGFYDTYDAGAKAVSNYLSDSREIGERLGVPVPIWQNMILALRARASSLESLFWNSRDQLLYQIQGVNRLHNETERLKSVIESQRELLGAEWAPASPEMPEMPASPEMPVASVAPMTPPPPPIKMTREITPMVDGEIQDPPPLQRVHSCDNALNGFDT